MAGTAVQTEAFSEMTTMGFNDATTHSFEDTDVSNQPPSTESDTELLEKYTELEMPPLDHHAISCNGHLYCAWADDQLCSHVEPSRTLARKHLKKHVRPYLCDVCEVVRTAEQAEMREHLKTHIIPDLRERFWCPKCLSPRTSFTREDNLLRHMKKKHPEA